MSSSVFVKMEASSPRAPVDDPVARSSPVAPESPMSIKLEPLSPMAPVVWDSDPFPTYAEPSVPNPMPESLGSTLDPAEMSDAANAPAAQSSKRPAESSLQSASDRRLCTRRIGTPIPEDNGKGNASPKTSSPPDNRFRGQSPVRPSVRDRLGPNYLPTSYMTTPPFDWGLLGPITARHDGDRLPEDLYSISVDPGELERAILGKLGHRVVPDWGDMVDDS